MASKSPCEYLRLYKIILFWWLHKVNSSPNQNAIRAHNEARYRKSLSFEVKHQKYDEVEKKFTIIWNYLSVILWLSLSLLSVCVFVFAISTLFTWQRQNAFVSICFLVHQFTKNKNIRMFQMIARREEGTKTDTSVAS